MLPNLPVSWIFFYVKKNYFVEFGIKKNMSKYRIRTYQNCWIQIRSVVTKLTDPKYCIAGALSINHEILKTTFTFL